MSTTPLSTEKSSEAKVTPRPPVTVLDDDGRVDKEVVHARRGEEVTWINNADHDVQIVFKQPGPFTRSDAIVVPHGEHRPSGPQKNDAQTEHEYKYTVIGFKNNNDPIVIIDK